MSWQSDDGRDRTSDAGGFTMIEALVALSIIAIVLAAIGSLVATNVRATRRVDDRLSLVETARAVLTGLPDGGHLTSGDLRGRIGDNRWRVDVLPFQADFVDPVRRTRWVPQAVVIRVQTPSGQELRLDTVRLRPAAGGQQ
jgi:general secretion pathway protein I